MSIKLMSDVWDVSVFKGNAKLIMLCLADFANDEGHCWPSHATIARKCTLSVSTVKAQIRKLITEGWLRVKNRIRTTQEGKKTNDSNVYQIIISALKNALATGGEFEPGANSTLGQNRPKPGANSGYKPPIDPPIDLSLSKSDEHPEFSAAQSAHSEQKPRRKTKMALPDVFKLNEAMHAWYAQQGFTLAIEQATAEWVDAMRAGDYRYVDWESAWRNGMRKQNQWSKERGGRPHSRRSVVNQASTNHGGDIYRGAAVNPEEL